MSIHLKATRKRGEIYTKSKVNKNQWSLVEGGLGSDKEEGPESFGEKIA